MKCLYCKGEVSAEEMHVRIKELWDKYKVIATIVPICRDCRDANMTKEMK